MFISQYFGGLAFISILAAYAFIGIFVILGIRMGFWNPRVLFYIPAFVFIFAIYYAVSSLAALLWRNTTLSIIVTIAFWLVCASIGFIRFFCDTSVAEQIETKDVISSNDQMFLVQNSGSMVQWDSESANWIGMHVADAHRRRGENTLVLDTPFYDSKHEVFVLNIGSFRNASGIPTLDRGVRFLQPTESGWNVVNSPELPPAIISVEPHPTEGFLVFTQSGIQRFTGQLNFEKMEDETENGSDDKTKAGDGESGDDDENKSDDSDDSTSDDSTSDDSTQEKKGGLFDFLTKPKEKKPVEFESLGPDTGYSLFLPWEAVVNQNDGSIAIYSAGTLSLFEQSDDSEKYRLASSIDVPGESYRKVKLGFGGETILIYRPLEGMIAYDVKTMAEKSRMKLNKHAAPKSIRFSPSGEQAAITLGNNELWIYDQTKNEFSRPGLHGQNSVFCAAFDENDQLIFADRWKSVSRVTTDGTKELVATSGKLTSFQWFYRYILSPIHMIAPKPGSLNNTAQYLVTGDDTRDDYRMQLLKTLPMGEMNEAMEDQLPRVYLNPWPPVWNGLIFTAVVLLIGCIILERQQF